MPDSPRVAVVALDAMDAGIALAMVADGTMPNLAALLERSWSRPVANPVGLLVGGVWPTYWTGCGPGRHGFYCHRQLKNGTYDVVPCTPAEMAVPQVWEVLSDAGRRCAVIDAPMSALVPDINGVQTVEWGAHDRIAPFSIVPGEFRAEVLEEFGDYPVVRCDWFTRDDDPAGLRRALLAGIDAKQRLATRCLRDGPWDLFVVGHSESHCAGHQFWSLHDPAHPRHDRHRRAELGDPLLDVYRAMDTALGRHLTAFGEAGTVFVVLSHGIGPHYDGDHLLVEILTRLDDAMAPPAPLLRTRERARRLADRAGRRKRGAVSVDGGRRFYRVPNNELYGGVRINLAGREPRGRVTPGPEADELVDALRRELLALTEPDTGRPIVADVLCTSAYHAGPARDALPDLLVDWVRTSPISGASSPTIGTVRGEYNGLRTGDHRPNGLLVVRGPGIDPSTGNSAVRSIDLAPTVAAMFGTQLPDAEGEPIAELVAAQR